MYDPNRPPGERYGGAHRAELRHSPPLHFLQNSVILHGKTGYREGAEQDGAAADHRHSGGAHLLSAHPKAGEKPQPPGPERSGEPARRECLRLLGEALDRVYPLVQPLGVAWPELRLRRMKSQWGNCHWRQGYITLNTALARCPETLRDYVALHELVHFVHPDHGPGFYGLMDRLMPDWRQRRKELRRYGGALAG